MLLQESNYGYWKRQKRFLEKIIEENTYLEKKELIRKKDLEWIKRIIGFWKKEKARPKQEKKETKP